MKASPTVAHVLIPFIRKTETFIYDRITGHCDYNPFVLTDEPVRNIEQFPFSPIYNLADSPLLERKVNTQIRRFFSFSPYFMRILRKNRPAVIHAHYGPVGVAIAKTAAMANLPLIVSFYGIDASAFLENRKYRSAYKPMFESAAVISVLSRDMGDRLREAGCPAHKLRIHHLAVDTNAFVPQRKNNADAGDGFRIVSVGRLVPKKGMIHLIRAFARFAGQVPDAVLQIFGSGPEEKNIQKEITRKGLCRKVQLMGYRPRKDILDAISTADVFALFSVTAPDGDREGTPTVLMEAGSLGVPSVSTLHAGIPEIIDDGKTGFLVQEKDEQGFAEALYKMWNRRDVRETAGRAAREKITAEFSIEPVMRQIERDYDKITGQLIE